VWLNAIKKKKSETMKSWQVYCEARSALKNGMYEVYGNRSSRMIDYWAQDPALSADPKRNPIDRLEALFKRLCEDGHRDVALSAVRILAEVIGAQVADREEVVPDKETLHEEILDDLPHLLAYQEALQRNDLEDVDRAKAGLDREMAENRVKFIEVNRLKKGK
jgi:hypothetical protein